MRVEHLSDSEIAGFLDRDLSSEELSSIESHLDSCQSCRAATVEVSRIAGTYEVTGADSERQKVAKRRRRLGFPAGIAAIAAAGLAIVWLGKVRTETQPASIRSATAITADSRPAIQVVGPPELVPAEGSSLTFIWESAAANLYRFAILDDTGNPVIERDLSDTVLVLPRSSVAPERLYFWRVDAVADGVVASSGPRKLRLAR